MILVSDIFRSVGYTLNDDDAIRWTLDERRMWLTEALYLLAIHKPSAATQRREITLMAGAYQMIEDCIQVQDIAANQQGHAVLATSAGQMNAADPYWLTARPGPVKQFTYDERNEKAFYVYPQAREGDVITVLVSAAPEVTADTVEIPLAREYQAPLVDYILFRSFAKDSEYANGQIAASYWQSFATALGIANQSTSSVSPNVARRNGQ